MLPNAVPFVSPRGLLWMFSLGIAFKHRLSILGATLSWLQWRALGACRHLFGADRWSVFPMFWPPIMLKQAGSCPSWVYKEIFVKNCYLLDELVSCRSKINRVIDLGANIGFASLYFARLFPNATIEAVEMNPHLIPTLRWNIRPFKNRVRVIHAAVSTQKGTATAVIDHDSASYLNTSLKGVHGADKRAVSTSEVSVECIAISDFLTAPAGLLKVDIEGAEYDVLASPAVKPENILAIVGELHGLPATLDQVDRIASMLGARGYRVELGEISDGGQIFTAFAEDARRFTGFTN